MQMRQRHERGSVLHSRATCRTQIYAEYTGGTIIIRLMHSSGGEYNLKLVGTGCDSPLWIVEPPSEEFRGIICVHSWFSLCYLSGFFQFDWQSYASIIERIRDSITQRFPFWWYRFRGFINFCFLPCDGFISFWEGIKKSVQWRGDDWFWICIEVEGR